MPERRRYTKRQKGAAIAIAELSSVAAAAEQTGIPRTTILYWREQPEFVELRQKTREDAAEGWAAIVHLAQAQISSDLQAGKFEPRDLPTLAGIATDKSLLLTGHATERHEHRELDTFDDHETRALVDAARKHLAGDTAGEGQAVAEDAAVE